MEIQSAVSSELLDTINSATASNTATEERNALGKDDFLRLLITQMEYQDPLDPMDNTEMIAQLAQFSALEQMNNLNSQFSQFRQEGMLLQSMLLTGKDVRLQMCDGSEVSGTIDKVLVEDGKLYFQIGEEKYAASDVVSISIVEESEESSSEESSSSSDSSEEGSSSDSDTTEETGEEGA